MRGTLSLLCLLIASALGCAAARPRAHPPNKAPAAFGSSAEGLSQESGGHTSGEERFFKDCPRRRFFHLHDEERPLDLHALLFTVLSLSELEFLRIADAVVDFPFPGTPLRPFGRATETIRIHYNRLPPWVARKRLGELVDALQLPELSLGDASATYSVATGGVAGPGSGMIIRVSKLIDWTEHVAGDLNRLSGRAIGRREGALRWSLPQRLADGFQRMLIRTFNTVSVSIGRTLENALAFAEGAGDRLVNLGYQKPHRERTVFLSLPPKIYRAHELWILENRPQLVLGTRESFVRSTHAALAHEPAPLRLGEWEPLGSIEGADSPIIVMTRSRVFSRAPDSLKPYVVPAEWVLGEEKAQ